MDSETIIATEKDSLTAVFVEKSSLALSECLPGQTAVVKKIGACSALLRAKLCSMRLCPGHEVKIMYRAPLKDPITVRVLGSQLALRLSEAAHIFVELKA